MKPANLLIDEQPLWFVQVSSPGRHGWSSLTVRDRTEWKRETAIAHARYFASNNPACTVRVRLS